MTGGMILAFFGYALLSGIAAGLAGDLMVGIAVFFGLIAIGFVIDHTANAIIATIKEQREKRG